MAAHSIHVLVRLLKSPADPPTTSGPSKIEIAWSAWSDASFRAPNKAEVVGEWLLSLLGQAKKAGRERHADPIADSRHWSLLSAVLTTSPPTTARPLKTWLLPLLSRFQVDAIVIELLALRSSPALAPAREALAVLWPLAEKKIGVDSLAECLYAVLNACTEWNSVDENLDWICSAVITAYRHALVHAGNKKKLYTSFLAAPLSSWLGAISTSLPVDAPSSLPQLQESIYAAGIDTLFSQDALKQPLDALFDALSTSISSLLPVLPKLCSSFLSATHRHRSALFASAASVVAGKEQVRKRGMEFVGRCWTLLRDSARCREDLQAEKWKSVIDVLRIVEKERFFVRGVHADATKGEHSGELALNEARDNAVEMLEAVNTSEEQAILFIQLLDVLVQIEYDFVGFVLERVLAAFINIPPHMMPFIVAASSEFLDRVLEYHIKTRTVHTYALALLGANATSSMHTFQNETSAFPLAFHLPALARALRASVTPTQTTPLATAVLQTVDRAWKAFENADEEQPRSAKKRKGTVDMEGTGRQTKSMVLQARVFTFTGRVAGTILSNLPASAYTTGEEYSLEGVWDDVAKLGWSVIWACIGANTEQEDDGTKGKREHPSDTDPLAISCYHMVVSAALRFLYDVRARVSSLLGESDRLDEAKVGTLLDALRDGVSKPELVLEIVRTVFWHIWHTHHRESQAPIETHPVFKVTFDIITSRFLSRAEWSGVSADLTEENLGLAVLYVLTERWIDVLDALASTEILERFISFLLDASLELSDEDARDHFNGVKLQSKPVITLRHILLRLLRNAQFWELHNMRAVFLSSLLTLTAPLSPYCFPSTRTEPPSLPKAEMVQHELAVACSAYSLLLYVPPEYFTRPVRPELVKRAMAGDVQLCLALEGTRSHKCIARKKQQARSDVAHRNKSSTEELDESDSAGVQESLSRQLTAVRIFLQRMARFLDTPNHYTYVNHLLNPPSLLSSPSKVLNSVSLDLVQLHILSLLRLQESQAAVSGVISTFINARPYSQPKSQETWAQSIVQSSILKLIEHATKNIDLPSLHDQVRCAFKTLAETLESVLSPLATSWLELDPRELDQCLSSDQLEALSRMLSLRRWLEMNPPAATTPVGLALATSMIRTGAILDSRICSSVLELLFEEIWCMPATTRRVHLDVLVAFYAIHSVERIMDIHVTHALKKMSVEDFSHLLDVLEEGIGGSGLRAGHRERLIHLGQVMLHDAPQGTLKVIQQFATRCFNLFADRTELYGGSSRLKSYYLEFIARHCSDRPAAIRSVDLGSIWSLLNRILSGSPEHDPTTEFPILHHVIAIIGALIRLRRDLIVHTLPHLGLVLRQLMMLTRKIRPQLGAKQHKIVTDTFPSWLSTSEPLSTDDARALARLLTALTTKTVPRTHTILESQKAESLAKPFAKHASYVLVAYVDAFNDPLCILNAEMRQALEPGLFALCEMVGEHSRDALMVSVLDSGGKAILKSLWNEYEKQRYVGKG